MRIILTILLLLNSLTSFGQLTNFKSGSLYGYKDKSGTIVIPATYENPSEFKNGYAMIYHEGYIVVIDSVGKLITKFLSPIGYGFKHSVNEGLFAAFDTTAQRFGYMNTKGNWVIKPKYWSAEDFIDGVAAVWEDPNIHRDTFSGCGTLVTHSKWGYINHSGEYIIKPTYKEPGKRQNGMIVFGSHKGELIRYDLEGNKLTE